MKPNFRSIYFVLPAILLLINSCQSRSIESNGNIEVKSNKIIGGGCDGCELMYSGIPDAINTVDTNAVWFEAGQRLIVSGTVYKSDKITPASDVILYYWQTDAEGYYSKSQTQTTVHGRVRGWVKTDVNGNYTIYTLKPASYPNDVLPSHIHFAIKEADIKNEYYTDELVFDDDPLLTQEKRNKLENRGGSGIVKTKLSDEVLYATHNIILGLNIPDYPN